MENKEKLYISILGKQQKILKDLEEFMKELWKIKKNCLIYVKVI